MKFTIKKKDLDRSPGLAAVRVVIMQQMLSDRLVYIEEAEERRYVPILRGSSNPVEMGIEDKKRGEGEGFFW
jgi:hypothetical protein